MESLFHSWRAFADAYRAATHVLLLFDYDGTLTPIVGRPRQALLAPAMKEKLAALARRPEVTLGVVSGRALAELKPMVGLDGLYYAGNHGLEIEGPGLSWVSPEAEAARVMMKDLVAGLAAALQETTGVIIEDKGLGVSVHYRLVATDEEAAVRQTFRRLTAPLAEAGKIKITSGKKVLEVRPPIDWHKGKAVEAIRREIMKLLKLEQVMTVYLGDDLTDEDAFRALRDRSVKGWGVYVGGNNPASAAGYYLDSTDEVGVLLDRLLALD
jgi:trehalose 6-phosphate phosphatase